MNGYKWFGLSNGSLWCDLDIVNRDPEPAGSLFTLYNDTSYRQIL